VGLRRWEDGVEIPLAKNMSYKSCHCIFGFHNARLWFRFFRLLNQFFATEMKENVN
jgi:hypothetical protein